MAHSDADAALLHAARQVIWLTGDRGACGLGPTGAAAEPIFVSHWGLLGPWADARAIALRGSDASPVLRDAVLRERPGAASVEAAATKPANMLEEAAAAPLSSPRDATLAPALEAEAPAMGAGSSAGGRRTHFESKGWCHAPHKDIIVPPFILAPALGWEAAWRQADLSHHPRPLFNVTYQLVHSGGICGWRNGCSGRPLYTQRPSPYSLGIRQRLFDAWGGEQGRRIRVAIYNQSVKGQGGFTRLVRRSVPRIWIDVHAQLWPWLSSGDLNQRASTRPA